MLYLSTWRGGWMNENSKKGLILTAQVVSETLESLPSTGRILVAARYLEGFKEAEMCKLFRMSEDEVSEELHRARAYIWSQCLDYQNRNKCELRALDEDIFKEAFKILLKQYVYKTFLNIDGTYLQRADIEY